MVLPIEIIRELSTLVFFDHESVRETKLSWKYVFSEMSSMFHLLSGIKLGVSRRRVRHQTRTGLIDERHPHSSEDMEIRIQSASAKVVHGRELISRSLPVFGDHDKIGGTLHLASKLATTAGRLTITVSMDTTCYTCTN